MAFAPTPSPLQWTAFPSLLPVWLEPGVMDLAVWNQLLANEDFPTGLGLGEEGYSCCLDSWPDCPLGKEAAEGERGHAQWSTAHQPLTAHTLLTGFCGGAVATSAGPLSLRVLCLHWLPVYPDILLSWGKHRPRNIPIQYVNGSQLKRKKKNEDGMVLL